MFSQTDTKRDSERLHSLLILLKYYVFLRHALIKMPNTVCYNRIDGMAVALEIILLWINREAQNKHFKDLI